MTAADTCSWLSENTGVSAPRTVVSGVFRLCPAASTSPGCAGSSDAVLGAPVAKCCGSDESQRSRARRAMSAGVPLLARGISTAETPEGMAASSPAAGLSVRRGVSVEAPPKAAWATEGAVLDIGAMSAAGPTSWDGSTSASRACRNRCTSSAETWIGRLTTPGPHRRLVTSGAPPGGVRPERTSGRAARSKAADTGGESAFKEPAGMRSMDIRKFADDVSG
jgi:hypothetical protein